MYCYTDFWSFITNPLFPLIECRNFSWYHISTNPNITPDVIIAPENIKYIDKWNWSALSEHMKMDMQIITNPKYDAIKQRLDIDTITYNKHIPLTDMNYILQEYGYIDNDTSRINHMNSFANIHITKDFMRSSGWRPPFNCEQLDMLASNVNLKFEDLIELTNDISPRCFGIFRYKGMLSNPNITFDHIKGCMNGKYPFYMTPDTIDWRALSVNPNITWKVVTDPANMQFIDDWYYDEMMRNPSIMPSTILDPNNDKYFGEILPKIVRNPNILWIDILNMYKKGNYVDFSDIASNPFTLQTSLINKALPYPLKKIQRYWKANYYCSPYRESNRLRLLDEISEMYRL